MAIHGERAFFEEILPTGNRSVKCPLMTSLKLKYAKMTLNVKIVFVIMNKRRKMDILFLGGRFHENEVLVGYGKLIRLEFPI